MCGTSDGSKIFVQIFGTLCFLLTVWSMPVQEQSHPPFNVQLLYVIETNLTTGKLQIPAKVGWKISNTSHNNDIVPTGFQIILRDGSKVIEIREVPIHDYKNQNHFVEQLDTSLSFGHTYHVKVRYLPVGGEGVTSVALPPLHQQHHCHKDSELSKLNGHYVSTFWLEYREGPRTLEVSFPPAPPGFCLPAYRITLLDSYARALFDQVLKVKNEAENLLVTSIDTSHMIGEGLILKVVPVGDSFSECICENCNCVTVTSVPFSLHSESFSRPLLVDNSIFSSDSHFTPSLPSSPIHIAIFLWIFLVLVLCCAFILILQTARRFILIRGNLNWIRTIPQSAKMLAEKTMSRKTTLTTWNGKSLLESGNLLVIGVPDPDTSSFVSDLTSKGFSVTFAPLHLPDTSNSMKWIQLTLEEADTILLIHSFAGYKAITSGDLRDPHELLFSHQFAVLSPFDRRLLHGAFDEFSPRLHPIETLFLFPRDFPLFLVSLRFLPMSKASYRTKDDQEASIADSELTMHSTHTLASSGYCSDHSDEISPRSESITLCSQMNSDRTSTDSLLSSCSMSMSQTYSNLPISVENSFVQVPSFEPFCKPTLNRMDSGYHTCSIID